MGHVLDPAELPGATGPRVGFEADQLVLDLLRAQAGHLHWLKT